MRDADLESFIPNNSRKKEKVEWGEKEISYSTKSTCFRALFYKIMHNSVHTPTESYVDIYQQEIILQSLSSNKRFSLVFLLFSIFQGNSKIISIL
jgi:hypothetical protein